MSVGEDNIHHIECPGIVPVFYQALFVGDEHVYLMLTGNVCLSTNGRHRAKPVNSAPEFIEQSPSEAEHESLLIP